MIRIADKLADASAKLPFPIALHREKTHTVFKAKCTKVESIAILQQLVFLATALRCSREGPPKLSKCKVDWDHDHFVIKLEDLCEIADTDQSCWHRIYQGGVIAYNLPIPQRGDEIGLELPHEMMISLTDTWYPVEHANGVILKGKTMALLPIAMSSTAVQWHLVTSNGPDLMLTLNDLADGPTSVLPLDQLHLAAQKRAILGYCSTAKIWLGTHDSGYQHIRLSSALPYKGSSFSLSRELNFAFGFAHGGTGSLGLKVKLPKTMMNIKSGSPNISDTILQSRDNSALLYSVDDGIADLVPELCVIMHFILYWASRQTDRKELLRKLPRAQPSHDGGLAAFETINQHKDLELRPKTDLGGQVTLIGLVTRFLQSLQGLKELSYSDEYLSFDRSSRIVGWEFVDIALGQQFQAAKKSDIQVSTAGNWSKALSKDPRIVNVFASRLGRPIRPDPSTTLCRAWDPLPLHKDFLVASLSCVAKLSERLGHDSYHPALSTNFNLHIPPGCCDPCDPADPNGCRRIADLRPKSVSLAEIPPPTGAIIIANRKCERSAMCEMGTDEMLQHLAIRDEHSTLCVSCCGSDKIAPPEDFDSCHDELLTATVHHPEDCDRSIVSQKHIPPLEASLIATSPRIEQSLASVYEPSDRADALAMPEETRSVPESASHAVLGSPTFAGQVTGTCEPRVEIVDQDEISSTNGGTSYMEMHDLEMKPAFRFGRVQAQLRVVPRKANNINMAPADTSQQLQAGRRTSIDEASRGRHETWSLVDKAALNGAESEPPTNRDSVGSASLCGSIEPIPEELLTYYDAVCTMRLMRERLDDLQVERQEQSVRRALMEDMGDSPEHTDHDFISMWDDTLAEAYHDLEDARKAVEKARDNVTCEIPSDAQVELMELTQEDTHLTGSVVASQADPEESHTASSAVSTNLSDHMLMDIETHAENVKRWLMAVDASEDFGDPAHGRLSQWIDDVAIAPKIIVGDTSGNKKRPRCTSAPDLRIHSSRWPSTTASIG